MSMDNQIILSYDTVILINIVFQNIGVGILLYYIQYNIALPTLNFFLWSFL